MMADRMGNPKMGDASDMGTLLVSRGWGDGEAGGCWGGSSRQPRHPAVCPTEEALKSHLHLC